MDLDEALTKLRELLSALNTSDDKGNVVDPRGTRLFDKIMRVQNHKGVCRRVTASLKDTVVTWELGEESPTPGAGIVWALVHSEAPSWIHKVVVYTFVLNGTELSFNHETIFNPAHVTGPISPDALCEELGEFLDGMVPSDGEPNGETPTHAPTQHHANGSA